MIEPLNPHRKVLAGWVPVTAAVLFFTGGSPAQTPAQKPVPAPASSAAPASAPDPALLRLPGYAQANAALRDRLPEVAVLKLRRLLDSSKTPAALRLPIQLLLAEALVRASRPAEALEVTRGPGMKEVPESRFWEAQALARLDQWREALDVFAALEKIPQFRFSVQTAFSHAGMLAALGEPAQAGRILAPLLHPPGTPTASRATLWLAELRLLAGQPAEALALLQERTADPRTLPERQYLQAGIALASGDPATAEQIFSSLSAPESEASARLQHAARLGRARALKAQGKADEAMPVLRQIVTTSPLPHPSILDAAFQELEALNHPPVAEMEAFLTTLSATAEPGVRIRARIALAAAMESVADPKQAEEAWKAIPRDFPDHPLRALALLRQAQFLTWQNRRTEARPLLDQLRTLSPSPAIAAWTAWVAGQTEYDSAAYRAASGYFQQASLKSPDPAIRAAAAYNAALAELQAGTPNPGQALSQLDGTTLPEINTAGAAFHLERALRMASLGDPAAIQGLEAFAQSMPDHPRRFDALIAMAEIAYQDEPRRTLEAAQRLETARSAARETWQAERVALLDCWLAEANAPTAPAGVEAFAAKANRFLLDYPTSASRSEVRMKLAQQAYQRENFSGARQLFEALAADDPLHPLAEPALFWAGRAAMLGMEATASRQAVVLWEKVFERNGPLKWQARLQEALIHRTTQPAAALQLLETILVAAPPADANTLWQALSLRGELLAAPGMSPAEQNLGLQSFDQILETADLPASWRQQTLVRKGVRLEALGRRDAALEAYYDVLAAPPVPAQGAVAAADDYWFHRAGDKAVRLLVAPPAEKYEEAIEIAKKMAKAPGPRGRAAAELVDELAFKYDIWTGTP